MRKTYEAEKKPDYIRIKLAPDLKARVVQHARRRGMTLSRYLRTLIEQDLAGKAVRP
jgi:predicted DNA binding CopG/RHH family protein